MVIVKHSVDIAGYQVSEGMQLFVGTRNVSFNLGRSNDLIVMLEKSIPTPPLINLLMVLLESPKF